MGEYIGKHHASPIVSTHCSLFLGRYLDYPKERSRRTEKVSDC